MNIFYSPKISTTPFLPEEESLHCIKVLRLNKGDLIHIIDGVGGFFVAKIVEPHPKKTKVEIIKVEKDFNKIGYNLHLAVAPTKNIDRFEWFLEKVTEIGVAQITPLICRYSERKVVKLDRLEKIIISAAKQSIKPNMPIINELMPFADFITNNSDSMAQKFIAHCYDIPKTPLLKSCNKGEDVVVLIGPEGDFSIEEVDLALNNGFKSVSLGNSRLRTETAGVVACHTVSVINEL